MHQTIIPSVLPLPTLNETGVNSNQLKKAIIVTNRMMCRRLNLGLESEYGTLSNNGNMRIWNLYWRIDKLSQETIWVSLSTDGADYSERTDVFSMVTNILVICVNWGGNNPIISSIYHDTAWNSTTRICRATATGSSTRCSFCWNSRDSIGAWRPSV